MLDGSQCMTLAAHEDDVTTSLFSPKDQIILTASKDIRAILWNFATGEQLFQLTGHNLSVIALSSARMAIFVILAVMTFHVEFGVLSMAYALEF